MTYIRQIFSHLNSHLQGKYNYYEKFTLRKRKYTQISQSKWKGCSNLYYRNTLSFTRLLYHLQSKYRQNLRFNFRKKSVLFKLFFTIDKNGTSCITEMLSRLNYILCGKYLNILKFTLRIRKPSAHISQQRWQGLNTYKTFL